MKHLGDITKLSGYVVPAVDVVIGGSPCQGLSVAGKQAGLKDERSGLFIEQIRLVKEMRKADAARGKTNDAIRPRYMVWENVPGAFSSNKGRDFEAVLEETVRVAEPKAPPVPVPAKGWPTSGCLMGDGWSVAWRVLDAQFWGTPDKPLPQRRRRISLVADFGGRTAPGSRVSEVRRENPSGRAGTVRVHLPGLQESELRPDEHRGCRNHKPEILLRLRPEHPEAHMGPGQALLRDVRRAG